MQLKRHVLALALAGITTPVWATNGMNMEGYGPIAAGMGGASLAYDNGTAAVMNNPATLGLMGKGSRLDVALGFLGPDVTSGVPAFSMTAASGGDAYYMPAMGYVRSDGKLSYGVGLFAQGGMGTEYAGNTFMSMGTGQPTRSELGVGRLIAPLAYQVTPELIVGGSLDFVWAMLDIKMVASSAQVSALTGGLDITSFGAEYAYLNFSDGSDFTGKAKGSGLAGKLGFTYKVNPMVTVGGVYHSKTSLGDLETGNTGTSFGLYNSSGAFMFADQGKITVVDFQWPEIWGLGLAVQATPNLLVAADYKRIGWKDVMKNFTMRYSSAAFGTVPMTIPQNWDDQDVVQLGVAYKATDSLTIRAGVNHAENPIPASTVHPLFPATVETHYTLGLGYNFTKGSELNFSLTYAPKVTITGTTAGMNQGVRIEHSQTNWQLMYTHRF